MPQNDDMFQTIVLSRDYIMEGTAPIDILHDMAEGGSDGIPLSDARIRSTGVLNTPARTFPQWDVPNIENIFAILVLSQSGQDVFDEDFEDFQFEYPITIYAGPFVIKGDALFDDDDPEWLESFGFDFFPIKDAVITCQLPNNNETLRAPLVFVNHAQTGGYTLEG